MLPDCIRKKCVSSSFHRGLGNLILAWPQTVILVILNVPLILLPVGL